MIRIKHIIIAAVLFAFCLNPILAENWYCHFQKTSNLRIKKSILKYYINKESDITKKDAIWIEMFNVAGHILGGLNVVDNVSDVVITGRCGLGNLVDCVIPYCTYTGWGALFSLGYTAGDVIYENDKGLTIRRTLNDKMTFLICTNRL